MPDEKTIRLKKIEKIREQGINPYPAQSERTHTCHNVVLGFDNLSKSDKKIILAGRLKTIRLHGGSSFAHIEDGTDTIQVYFKKDILGDEQFFFVRDLLDGGDFIQVSGKLFTTKTGEKTLEVESLKLLAKALLPLPEKWHGLVDTEIRFRKRYLDLVMNPEIKKRFRVRAKTIALARQFLDEKEYLEVQTPILQPIYGGGLARPFKTHHNTLNVDLYLRIANELYLKRLIVGGFERVYEICTDFRNEGIDHRHYPEFTLLEAMTAYQDYKYSMDLVEEMNEFLAREILGATKFEYQGQKIDFKRPWKRLSMVEAIRGTTGINVLSFIDEKELTKALLKAGIEKEKIGKANSWGLLVNLLFEEKVEKTFIQPTIVYDHPVETSPLAKKCLDDPRFVERFEHYVMGWEMGNHYSELNDPLDLRERFIEEKKKTKAGFEEAHQTDEDFLEAIEHGMPPATGIGVSIDRLAMLFTDTDNIKEVILFPTLRPKK